ncbi:hypothetical protein ACFQZ4_33240 [Catellatospora coxensis]
MILSGESPDPSRIPAGCRFHPRCPALAGGLAQRAGIADRCVGEPLPVLPLHGPHAAACLLSGHVGDGIAGAAAGSPTGLHTPDHPDPAPLRNRTTRARRLPYRRPFGDVGGASGRVSGAVRERGRLAVAGGAGGGG